jgi:4-amino-4-deoxy-L-arabinose transferase-like glycosyltransferase
MHGISSFLRQHRLAVALLLLAAAALARLPHFNESLWYDEVWYTSVKLNENSLRQVLFHDVHPPFYPVLMKGWIELFGDSEIPIRLPSLLFGLASLGVLFALTRTWFDRRTALLATVLMSFSPVHIWHSQEAKNNMLLLLLTLLTVYGLQRAWTHNGWRDWLLFVVSAILGLWTNHFSLWVVLSAFLWLWLQAARDRRDRSLKRIAAGTVAVALGYLPPLWLALRDAGAMDRAYLRPFTAAETYKLFLIYLSHGNTLRTVSPYAPFRRILEQPWSLFLIDGFFALLLGWGLFLTARNRSRRRKETGRSSAPDPAGIDPLMFYFLVPPIALLAASFFHPRIYIERSMIILLPPFFILLSHGVMSLSRPRWRTVGVTALVSVNILSLANFWVLKRDAWTVYKPNPDWRAFARDVREETNRTVVFTSCPPLALQYYMKESGSIPIIWLGSDRNADGRVVGENAHRLLNGLPTRYPRFFYVAINRYWGDRYASKLNEEVFGRTYPLLETKRYFALDVYKYGLLR